MYRPWLFTLVFISCVFLSSVYSDTDTPCVDSLPENCTCAKNGTSSQIFKVHCSNLTEIPETIPAATYIYIQNGSIPVLSDLPWQDGSGITTLSLQSNEIIYIVNGVFKSLVDLHALYLSYNNIGHLEPMVFQGLNKLERLILDHNPLYHIMSDTFDGKLLPSLSHLGLSHSKLYSVDPGFVDSLASLSLLTMDNNHLRTLPILGCPGHSLDQLSSWVLHHNEIESFDNTSAGCHMARISVIDLSYNKLSWVDRGTLGAAMTNLSQLNLQHNNLASIHSNTFEEAKKLNILELSYNKLTYIAKDSLPWDTLDTVYIHDNPWDCNCGNDWIVSHDAVTTKNNKDSVRCTTPDHFYNRSVFGIDESTLQKCSAHSSHILGLSVGIIACIVALTVGCAVFYRLATRKRANKAARSTRLPRGTLTSSYRRMDDDHDVTFTPMDEVRPYRSTTEPVRERAPIKDELHNFSI